MTGTEKANVTVLLRRWQSGDAEALEAMLPQIYAELERLARAQLNRDFGATLQPSELVAEAYLKLVNVNDMDFSDRAHFFSIAARIMRRVLVDRYRRREAIKRGSGKTLLTLNQFNDVDSAPALELERLDDALNTLEKLDARQAEIVNLRFFGGLRVDEIAALLKLSDRTIKREWAAAKLWLYREIAA
mgnify:CR=1 FL=1